MPYGRSPSVPPGSFGHHHLHIPVLLEQLNGYVIIPAPQHEIYRSLSNAEVPDLHFVQQGREYWAEEMDLGISSARIEPKAPLARGYKMTARGRGTASKEGKVGGILCRSDILQFLQLRAELGA